MDLPPLDKRALAELGIASDAVPIPSAPTDNFGIEFRQEKLRQSESLTAQECIDLFGTREAVLMNFIPQMLTAIALEQAEDFIKYCADNKITAYKRHNREMRRCITEYNYELQRSYGRHAWKSYETYLNRFRDMIRIDLFQCWCTYTNEASRQFIGHPHKDIPARVAFVRMLLTFVEDFERNMDKLIGERLQMPCSRKREPYSYLVSVLCMDIAETFGYKMQITENMALCVKVLVNRCRSIVDDIMADEDASECGEALTLID